MNGSEKRAGDRHHLLLFVAGSNPVSEAARNGAIRLCDDLLQGHCELTVVDVLEDFETANDNGVFVTPCLLWLGANKRVVGDLSDARAVLRLFDMKDLGDASG